MATKVKLIADNVITTSQIDTSSLDAHFTGGTGVTYSSGEISIGQAVATDSNVTFADLTVTGDLNITGDINSYNVTDLDVTDKTITLGAGQIEDNSGGSGIIVDGSEASILWDETNDWWDYNKGIRLDGEGLKLSFRTSSTSADGEIYTGDTFGSNRLIIAGDNGIHNVIDGNANGVSDWSVYNDNTSTHLLYVTGSNGYVGIGDSSPNVKLVVSTASGDTALAINDDRSNVSDYTRIDFRHNNITGSQIKSQAIEDFSVDANRTSDLSFHTRNNGTIIDAMHIQEDGKVGIGTSSPNHKLDVYSSERFPLRVHRTSSDLSNTQGVGIGFSLRGDAATSTSDTRAAIMSQYNGDFYIAVDSGGNLNTTDPIDEAALFIEGSNKNVGIGTNSPTSTFTVMGTNTGYVASNGSAVNGLHIVRTSSYGENIYLYTTDGNAIGWSGIGNVGRIESYGNNAFEIGSQQNAPIIIGTNDAEKLRITSNTIQLNGGNQSYSDNQRVLSESENITWPSSTSAQSWTSSNSLPYQKFVEAALHFGYVGNGAISQHFYLSLLNNFTGLSIQTIQSSSGNSGSSYHTISFTSTGSYNSRKIVVQNTPAGGQNTANLSGTIYYGFAR